MPFLDDILDFFAEPEEQGTIASVDQKYFIEQLLEWHCDLPKYHLMQLRAEWDVMTAEDAGEWISLIQQYEHKPFPIRQKEWNALIDERIDQDDFHDWKKAK